MAIENILHYSKGYLEIYVSGEFLERFLNIATRRNIYLWNVRRDTKGGMRVNISIKGFKLLQTIAYKSKSKIKIVKRVGVPFFVHKYRKRYAILIGMLIFAGILGVWSQFLWTISVDGNNEIPTEKVMELLQNEGIKRGILKKKLNCDDVESRILIDNENISYIAINLKGTTAFVELRERGKKPELQERKGYANIVATDDGVVESITVKNGVATVGKGDSVNAGQVLISGLMDSKNYGVLKVVAKGEVKLKTWVEQKAPINQKEEIRTRTGKNKSKHIIRIFNFPINLFFSNKVDFENFDRVSYVSKYEFFGLFPLPIAFHYDKYYEVNVTYKSLTEKEIYKNLQNTLDKVVQNNVILNKKEEKTNKELILTYEILKVVGSL